MSLTQDRHGDFEIARDAADNVGIAPIEATVPFQRIDHEAHGVLDALVQVGTRTAGDIIACPSSE